MSIEMNEGNGLKVKLSKKPVWLKSPSAYQVASSNEKNTAFSLRIIPKREQYGMQGMPFCMSFDRENRIAASLKLSFCMVYTIHLKQKPKDKFEHKWSKFQQQQLKNI